jgi:hypothetical protein
VSKQDAWRRPELDAVSDADFAVMPIFDAEALCALYVDGKARMDEGGLNRLRYINELRSRLHALAVKTQ